MQKKTKSKQPKLAARIIFRWQLKDITQAEHYSSDDGGIKYSGCDSTDKRSLNGVMLVEVNHASGFNPKMEYGLIIDMLKADQDHTKAPTNPVDRQISLLTVGSL
jgi:hypothetical protein